MRFEKILATIIKAFNIIGMIALIAMMVVVAADVVMRFAFRRVVPGATELAQVTFLCMMASVPLVILINGNTMVDVFISKFPRALRRVINLITVALTNVFCFLMGWQMIESAKYSYRNHITYTLSRIPEWLVYGVFGVSCFIMILAGIVIMMREWKNDAPEKNLTEKRRTEKGCE